MDPNSDLVWESFQLTVDGLHIDVSSIRREARTDPVLILHGFGGTKEDYLDIALIKALSGVSFILYDAPGSGQSTCQDLSKVSIPFLVTLAEEIIKHHGVKKFHLIGHSMGGLTALKLAQKHPDAVLSFVNIKGNLAREDCFLSRQVLDYPSDNPEEFFRQFIERTRRASQYGNGMYASALQGKVQAAVAKPIFESMVHISDNQDLLRLFETLPCPRMFMFGEQYNTLSYLDRLLHAGVELAEIPHAGHFIMYSNPVEMWQRIGAFLKEAGCV